MFPDSFPKKMAQGLTRHKISDRARKRAWPQARRTSYTKATHRSGARFAAAPG